MLEVFEIGILVDEARDEGAGGNHLTAVFTRVAERILDEPFAQPLAAADQLLVEPSGTDNAGLPLNRQVRFHFHGHAAQALREAEIASREEIERRFAELEDDLDGPALDLGILAQDGHLLTVIVADKAIKASTTNKFLTVVADAFTG